MHRSLTIFLLASSLAPPTLASAATFTDDFEAGVNAAGWSYIQDNDTLEPAGGNPGGWLHQPVYDTFDPALLSAWGGTTPFTGDYRAAQVSRIGFDLQTLDLDFGDGSGFDVVLLLRNTHGTPDDFDDDDYAYAVGPNIPLLGQGWVHYDVDIPSQSNDAVPAGWSGGWSGDCENFRPGVSWEDVVTNVDRVEIHSLHPCFFAIFQQWNVGADNISIDYVEDPTPVEEASWGSVKQLYRR